MVLGDPDTPVEVIVTVPLCVPAVRPAVSRCTPKDDGAVPEAEVSVIQAALSTAVQLTVPPPPWLVTFTVVSVGVAPPSSKVTSMADGLTPSTGSGDSGGPWLYATIPPKPETDPGRAPLAVAVTPLLVSAKLVLPAIQIRSQPVTVAKPESANSVKFAPAPPLS